MRFRVLYNNGNNKYIQAKSNKAGDEIEERLKIVKIKGHIKNFERLEFEKVTPNDILNDDQLPE